MIHERKQKQSAMKLKMTPKFSDLASLISAHALLFGLNMFLAGTTAAAF